VVVNKGATAATDTANPLRRDGDDNVIVAGETIHLELPGLFSHFTVAGFRGIAA